MENFTFENVVLVAAIVYCISLHELGHAIVAYWCGDDTAKKAGRITLNPLPSIDPLGSIIVPAFLVFFAPNFLFGWAKPVTVLPERLRPRVVGDILVSMAGIVVNLILAFLFLLILEFTDPNSDGILFRLAKLNVILAVLNMIPVPPFDGHHVFKYLLPKVLRPHYERIGFLGVALVFGAIYLVPEARRGFMTGCFWTFEFVEGAAETVATFFS